MKRFAFLASVALLLAGCGSDIEAGYVTGKVHEPAWAETHWSDSCQIRGSNGVCKHWVRKPDYIYHAEQWRLDLRDGDKTGYVYVPAQTWDRYNAGDRYPVAK